MQNGNRRINLSSAVKFAFAMLLAVAMFFGGMFVLNNKISQKKATVQIDSDTTATVDDNVNADSNDSVGDYYQFKGVYDVWNGDLGYTDSRWSVPEGTVSCFSNFGTNLGEGKTSFKLRGASGKWETAWKRVYISDVYYYGKSIRFTCDYSFSTSPANGGVRFGLYSSAPSNGDPGNGLASTRMSGISGTAQFTYKMNTSGTYYLALGFGDMPDGKDINVHLSNFTSGIAVNNKDGAGSVLIVDGKMEYGQLAPVKLGYTASNRIIRGVRVDRLTPYNRHWFYSYNSSSTSVDTYGYLYDLDGGGYVAKDDDENRNDSSRQPLIEYLHNSTSYSSLIFGVGPYGSGTMASGQIWAYARDREAKINSTYYSTLEAAIKNASAGSTVEILVTSLDTVSNNISKTLTITSTCSTTITWDKNRQSSASSAMFNISGSVTVTFGGSYTITLNGSSEAQRAIYISGTSATCNLSSVTIQNFKNTSLNGGAIYSEGKLNLSGTAKIDNNSATNGGGVYVYSGTATMADGTISNNTATNGGGGVYVYEGTATMTGGTISNNTATNHGGGIFIVSGSRAEMTGGTISNNTATSQGGGIFSYGDLTISGGTISGNKVSGSNGIGGGICSEYNLTIRGGTISGNKAEGSNGSGGGIHFNYSSGTLAISDTAEINGNSATNGAGVYVNSGTMEMTGGTISNNTATNSGGGIYFNSSSSTLTISDKAEINGNSATSGGAGIYITSGTMTMTGGTISSNTADYGGGIYKTGTGLLKISNTAKIDGNSSTADGGGIYIDSGTATMTGGTISNNTATNYGGGIFSHGDLTISGGTISGNTAGIGGGICVDSGTATMTGGTISNNTASTDGGGIYSFGDLTISGGTISGNKAKDSNGSGGGIYFEYSSATLAISGKAKIDGNSATNGGGVYVYEGTATMTGGTISNNTASTNGGGIYSNDNLTISGGTISGNKANGIGGGIYFEYSSSTLTISGTANIYGNSATNGGGIYIASGTMTMTGGTISNNTATSDGGGIYFDYSSGTLAIRGTAEIDGNSATNGGGVYVYSGTLNMTGGTISKNTATNYGGGIFSSGNLAISGGTISGNKAEGSTGSGGGIYFNYSSGTLAISDTAEIDGNSATVGGGIYIASGTATMTGGTISNNTATTIGGGIYIASSGTATMTSGTISKNTATNAGGGIYIASSGTATMTDGTISNNTASTNGGGIYSSGNLAISGGTISKNTATSNGGGIYFMYFSGTLAISGTANIDGNSATNGAGVYVNSGTMEMTGGTISGNTASGNGGGIYSGNKLTISGGTISGNKAEDSNGSGGGVYVYFGGTKMTGGTISGNKASRGGGVYIYAGTAKMTGGTISNNTATSNGGGIYFMYSTAKLTISGTANIDGNSATNGAGVYVNSGTMEMTGGTISNNTASGNGGGIYNAGSLTISGGIVSGNSIAVYTTKDFTLSGVGDDSNHIGRTYLAENSKILRTNNNSSVEQWLEYSESGNIEVASPKSDYVVFDYTDSSNTAMVSDYGKVSIANKGYELAVNGKTLILKATPYTITYNLNGGSGVEKSQTYNIETNLTLYGTPTRAGYKFDGWKVTTASGNWTNGTTFTASQNVGTGKYGNITLTAQWTGNKYSLTIDNAGGSNGAISPTSYTTSETAQNATITLPTRTGYTCAGWTISGNTGTATVSADKKTLIIGANTYGDIKLTANWTINSYTLTANANGGTIPATTGWTIASGSKTATKSLNYGAQYDTLPTPNPYSKTGYTVKFKGWFTSASGGSPVSATTTMGASNTTIYAQWTETINSYTLTANANGGTISSASGWTIATDKKTATKSVTYASTYGTLPTATRTGYTFGGWYLQNKFTVDLEPYQINAYIGVNGATTPNAEYSIYKLPIKAGATYTIVNSGQSTAPGYAIYDKSDKVLASKNYANTKTITFTAPANSSYILFSVVTQTTSGRYDKTTFSLSSPTDYVTSLTIVTNPNAHTLLANWTANSLTFAGANLNDATFASEYTSNAVNGASNGTGNYKYEIVSGAPAEIKLSVASNKLTFSTTKVTSNVGPYTIVVKATDTTSGATANAKFVLKIVPATSTITLSATKATVAYGDSTTFTITYNGDGKLSAVSANASLVTVSLSGTTATVTVVAYKASTTVNVTVSATAGTNYKAPANAIFAVTLAQRAITVASDGASKVYDGNALTKYTAKITSGTLASGDTIAYAFTGTITNVGTADNEFTATIKKSTTDVTGYYAITYTYGKLTVTAKSVAVPTANTTTFTYNGSAQTYTPANWSVISAYVNISNNVQTNAESYTVTIELKSKTNYVWSDNTTANKTLTFTINKKSISLTWTPNEFTYDGSAKCPTATTNTGITGQTFTFTYTVSAKSGSVLSSGKAINVGNYTVKATPVAGNGTSLNNYTLSSLSKDFKITQATLSTPTELGWNKGIASWKAVNGIGAVTVSYQVVLYKGTTAVTNGTVTVSTNRYDFSALIRKNETGTYTFKVTAKSSNTANVNDSAQSSASGNQYAVKITVANGTGIDTATINNTSSYVVINGESGIAIVAKASAGYTFKDWTTNNDAVKIASSTTASTTISLTLTKQVADITITANTKANAITIKWDGNAKAGDLILAKFWNYAGSKGYTSSNTGSNSKYTTNGVIATSSVTYNTALGYYSPLPIRRGYTFNGWFTLATNGTKVADATGSLVAGVSGYTDANKKWINASATTLYAQWTAKTYTISYDYAGGNATNPTSYNVGTTGTIKTPTRTGYTFAGWNIVTTLDKMYNATINLQTGIMEYASGSANATFYEMFYLVNGVTYKDMGTVGEHRWRSYDVTTGEYKENMSASSTATGNGTNIMLWPYNGDSNATRNISFSLGASDIDLATQKFTGNLKLVAKWAINSYTLTIKPNGGVYGGKTTDTTITQDYNTTYTVANPTRTGYTFGGWDKTGEGTLTGTTFTFGAGNATLTAKWTINKSKLTIDPNGGSVKVGSETITESKTYEQNYNTTLSIAVPTRTGYSFAGWTKSTTFDGKLSSTTGAATYTFGATSGKTDTITATWKAVDYTITFNANGGNAVVSKTYTIETDTFKLATTTRQGYTFAGWKVTKISGSAMANKVAVTVGNIISQIDKGSYANITVEAQWTANSYKISLDEAGGTGGVLSKTTYSTSESAQTFEVTTSSSKTGYVIDKYEIAITGGSGEVKQSGNTFTILAGTYGDIELTIVWKARGDLEIKYFNKVGTSVAKIGNSDKLIKTYTYGQPLDLVDATCANYTFDGWYIKQGDNFVKVGNKLTAERTSTDAGITLYANWTYTIVFNTNAPAGTTVTGVANKGMNSGDSYAIAEKLTLDGYRFLGWKYGETTINVGDTVGDIKNATSKYHQISPTNSKVILTASWDKDEKTITVQYKVNGYTLNGKTIADYYGTSSNINETPNVKPATGTIEWNSNQYVVKYKYAEKVQFNIVTDGMYNFTIKVDNVDVTKQVSNGTYTIDSLTKNKSIVVEFTIKTFTVTITQKSPKTGTLHDLITKNNINYTPGVVRDENNEVVADGKYTFVYGERLTYYFAVNSGYIIGALKDGDTSVALNNDTYLIGKLTSDHNLVIEYTEQDTWLSYATDGKLTTGPAGTSTDPYIIDSAEKLAELAKLVFTGNTFSGKYFIVKTDISLAHPASDVSKSPYWFPIGINESIHFAGNFNGDGYTVSDMEVLNGTSIGLFGYSAGTIYNVKVSGSVTGSEIVGGVVGTNAGTVNYAENNATLIGKIGSSRTILGGVVGYNTSNGKIHAAANAGAIGGQFYYAGGIAGKNGGSIYNAYNSREITSSTSTQAFGGIVGYSTNGNIGYIYNYGKIANRDNKVAGQFVGQIEGTETVNIKGYYLNETSSATNSYDTGLDRSKTQMKPATTYIFNTTSIYAGWNLATNNQYLDNIWEIRANENDGYPVFKIQKNYKGEIVITSEYAKDAESFAMGFVKVTIGKKVYTFMLGKGKTYKLEGLEAGEYTVTTYASTNHTATAHRTNASGEVLGSVTLNETTTSVTIYIVIAKTGTGTFYGGAGIVGGSTSTNTTAMANEVEMVEYTEELDEKSEELESEVVQNNEETREEVETDTENDTQSNAEVVIPQPHFIATARIETKLNRVSKMEQISVKTKPSIPNSKTTMAENMAYMAEVKSTHIVPVHNKKTLV